MSNLLLKDLFLFAVSKGLDRANRTPFDRSSIQLPSLGAAVRDLGAERAERAVVTRREAVDPMLDLANIGKCILVGDDESLSDARKEIVGEHRRRIRRG